VGNFPGLESVRRLRKATVPGHPGSGGYSAGFRPIAHRLLTSFEGLLPVDIDLIAQIDHVGSNV
jgi:hypothetical protein